MVKIAVLAGFCLPLVTVAALAEIDHEFRSGSSLLGEGFPGLSEEPRLDPNLEPIDGMGGFDNVAPRLAAEVGPGGQVWNPSPSYRTRYMSGDNYPAGSSQLQGNNWFTSIPYLTYDSGTNQCRVRFDANTFRVYTYVTTNTWGGQYANKYSTVKKVGNDYYLYDTDGRLFLFPQTTGFQCSLIDWLGGVRTSISHGGSEITVLQQTSTTSGSEVRKIHYYLSANRIDKIEIEDNSTGTWTIYRKIDFTYRESTDTTFVESSVGDLIEIKEETLLSPSSTWLERKWVFKYYVSGSSLGYPYQVKAVLGPESVRDYEQQSGSPPGIHTQTATQLASFVDRTYEYDIDKRATKIDFKSGCGCGGAEGAHLYAWPTSIPSPPSDLNTWAMSVKISLPDPDGAGGTPASARIADYNKYGQRLNYVVQEDANSTSSRRWIQTWTHDSVGRLTESFSVRACDGYNDSTHVVTTNGSAGQRYQLTYSETSSNVDTTVKLRQPSFGSLFWQRKTSYLIRTSGDRKRFLLNTHTTYPTEDTTGTNGLTTTYSYTYYTTPNDPLSVQQRTTSLPAVTTTQNGSGSSVSLLDYFESDGRHTWSKDGDSFVHYTEYNSTRWVVTRRIVDIKTNDAGMPTPPTGFATTAGLSLETKWENDHLRRVTKQISPKFDSWNGTSIVNASQERRWLYTRLAGHELVTVEYPHVTASLFFDAALSITVSDHDGHVVNSVQGLLNALKQDDTLTDDVLTTQAAIEGAFQGTIVRRSDNLYDGSKLLQSQVYTDADNTSGQKIVTEHGYDGLGRRSTTKTPAGTITRTSYDVLNRAKKAEVGTDAGSPGNMTLVEERFYDDEEDTATKVGDGNLTRVVRYTSYAGGAPTRTTNYAYDYRQRLTQTDEPLSVRETRTYGNDNRGLPATIERFDTSSGSVLLAKEERFYDNWGRAFETRTYGVTGGSASGYASSETWWNARGQVIKTLGRGKVFQKTLYDGAGRVTTRAVTYDETERTSGTYANASNLTGDTVIEETRYALDKTGAVELVGSYQRRHNGTGTGALTVGSAGNARPQYSATWYDLLHRATHSASYGTNGGSNPADGSGNLLRSLLASTPPSASGPSESAPSYLVTIYTYTKLSQVEDVKDPQGIVHRSLYDDLGNMTQRIDDQGGTGKHNRTATYGYDYVTTDGTPVTGQLVTITAERPESGAVDQTTQYVYGVTRGSSPPSSLLASNDLLQHIRYPDPSTGAPSTAATDQEWFAYNALGETTWREDQAGTEHTLVFDDRGRLLHDRVTDIEDTTNVDGAVRRISRTYDKLDRVLKVSSYASDDPNNPSSQTPLDEVLYEYDRFGVVKTLYQEWTGAVSTGSSPRVAYAHSFPTDGTTAVRRTSTTYKSGKVVSDAYDLSTTDDILSRLSGRKESSSWIFKDEYLGLGRLVQRTFGATGYAWTLVGTDTPNQDNYLGLDRFARIDELKVKYTASGSLMNDYRYGYNYNSHVTLREDMVGNVYGSYEFDETWVYDGLSRLVEHLRGVYSGGSMGTVRLKEAWTLDPQHSGADPAYSGLDHSGNTKSLYVNTGGSGSTTTADFNASNEYVQRGGVNHAYSDAGNLLSGGTFTQKYDAWNRMVEVKSGSTVVSTYRYNGLNRLIERKDSPTLPRVYYYWGAEDQLLEEWNVGYSSVHAWYVWGSQYIDDVVVYSDSSSAWKFVAWDHNFNTTTRFDSSGNVINRYVYVEYGTPKQLNAGWWQWQTITADLPLFTGRTYLTDHGRACYRNREMDSGLMAWLQRDPMGPWIDNLNAGNPYGVTGNDPANRGDKLAARTKQPSTSIPPSRNPPGAGGGPSPSSLPCPNGIKPRTFVFVSAVEEKYAETERGDERAEEEGVQPSPVKNIAELNAALTSIGPCECVQKVVIVDHGGAGIMMVGKEWLVDRGSVAAAFRGVQWCQSCLIDLDGCDCGWTVAPLIAQQTPCVVEYNATDVYHIQWWGINIEWGGSPERVKQF